MAAASADSILNAIIADLTEFRGAAAQQDDITLVVVKLM
jgi:serine phosphatase RsbU (regulator of sigma subunit)